MLTFKRLVSAAVLVVSAIAPIAVSAETGNSDNSGNSGRDQGATSQNFCVRITSVRGEFNSKLTELETNRNKNRSDIMGKLQERKMSRDGEVHKMRGDAEKLFGDSINKIETDATTDAQKAAVAAFKASVLAALATRKTAVDAANLTFRNARDPLVAKRQDALKVPVATLKASIAAAIAKAQADCKLANSDPVAIRQALMNSIKAAITQFHTDANLALGTIGQQISALAATRNAAVKAANQAFKAAVGQARQTLKAAFPSL